MSSLLVYCRFCAKEKPSDATINFMTVSEKRNEVITKLSLFGNNFIDFDNKTLPQYICGDCCNSLEFSYKFFVNVKTSQVFLEDVFSKAISTENAGEHKTWKKEKMEDDYPDCETQFEEAPPPSWSTYPWKCSHCELTMDSLWSLRAHTKSQHATCFGYLCADCGNLVDELEDFVEHVTTHREELRNYCVHCNMYMSDRSHRDTHLTEHCCTLCGETFAEETDLLAHLKQYVTKSTGLLAFDVSIYESYDTSEVKCWADYPNICKFCKIQVFSKDILTSHCMDSHGSCFGMQCMDCDHQPDTFEEFVQHVHTHRPDLKIECRDCDMDMSCGGAHAPGRYPCRLCGECFPHRRKLWRHRQAVRAHLAPTRKKRKTPPTEEDLTCKTCGAVLTTEYSLKIHKSRHEIREKQYTCERCGLAFYTKSSLEAHRKIHETTSQETCKICKRTFLNLSRLRKHVQTHNLIKPFQCDECKKHFSSKERLRSHITLHSDVFPYSCDFCAKKFRYKNLLKVHENQHTGARPYSCRFCGMVFANWSNCNKHMKRKHDSTLAKSVRTPQGKVLLNPKTGKPYQLTMNAVVKEWSEKILSGGSKSQNKKRGKKQDEVKKN